jgi:hypothetical protein
MDRGNWVGELYVDIVLFLVMALFHDHLALHSVAVT